MTTRKWKLAKSWSVVRWESEFGAAERKKRDSNVAGGGHKWPEMICQSDPPDKEVTVGGSTSGLYEAEKVWRGKCGCYRRFIA